MKILMVAQPFGNVVLPWTGAVGSIDVWIYEVARRLARSCDVTVYTRKNRYQKKPSSTKEYVIDVCQHLSTNGIYLCHLQLTD